MPVVGSQVVLCDLPVHFDTYKGCSHACRYCFANRKSTIANIGAGESVASLRAFVNGERTASLKWLDWKIPIHFGGMSDPFQPIEQTQRKTLDALKILAEAKYPFVISTKNKLIADEPYFSLIKESECVVQISAACSEYDEIEKGASTFSERMDVVRKIAEYKRVIIRVQPYLPQFHEQIMKSLDIFADSGSFGITVEGMKYLRTVKGTIRCGGDNVFPAKLLRSKYVELRNKCHAIGLRFYCAENRLRSMGDDLCCCGIDGLGWQTNKGNIVHLIHGDAEFTKAQKEQIGCGMSSGVLQGGSSTQYDKSVTFEQFMRDAANCKKQLSILFPES